MARLFLLAALLVAPAAAVAEDGAPAPVMKVVRMLQDMQAELTKDLEDDKAVHEMLDCWCTTNEKEKTKAIELGTAKIAELEAFLGEAAAQMKEKTQKRNDALDEVDADFNALSEAKTLRMKENKEFHAEEMNLIEASKSCQQAVVALGNSASAAPSLAQIKIVAQHLDKAKVLSMGRISPSQLRSLKAFLSEADKPMSFLQIPGMQSYAPQGGQIVGILEQMKEDFDKDLADEQAKEKASVEQFQALKAAKDDEIAAGKELVTQMDQQIADLKEKHAQSFKELEDTEKQLALDQEFLANLSKKCSVSDEEFDKRVKDRMTEIAAVEDTIKILNDDSSFAAFGKTEATSFLQQESISREQQRQIRKQVATVLERAAAATGIEALSLLATRAQLDAFTEVKAEIDKMVAELKKQQQDEVEHRDFCIKELNQNKRTTDENYEKKDMLTQKMADLEKSIKELTENIEATTNMVKESQVQMTRASETREAENGDFQQTVADQRVTQQILNKALDRMKQVYAFLESQKPGAAHTQTSATHTDPGNGPAAFKDYEQNAGGSKVVSMIEEVIADSKKTEDDAMASEEDSQTAYENFMQDSNKAIAGSGDKLTSLAEAKAKAQEEHTLAKTDLSGTVVTLEDLNNAAGDLHKACDFVMKNFEARQSARSAEMDAMNEAKSILSGAK